MPTRFTALLGVGLFLASACATDPMGDCTSRCETRRTSRCMGFRGEEDCAAICADAQGEYDRSRDAALEIECEVEFDASYACEASVAACSPSGTTCASERAAYGECLRTVCERLPEREECLEP